MNPAARAATDGAPCGTAMRSHSDKFIVFPICFVKIMRPSGLRSISMKSPSFTCPVETKLASGNTRFFSMARFKWRAPYRKCVPSFNKKFLTF
jgi:hypothetical protein